MLVFTLSSHWLLVIFIVVLIGVLPFFFFDDVISHCPLQGFYASQHIAHKLNSSRGDFQRVVGVQVGYIGVSQCPLMHCPENYSCQTVYKPQNKQIRIMSERTTYTSYEHSRSHACMCNRDAGKIMRKLVVYDSFGRI